MRKLSAGESMERDIRVRRADLTYYLGAWERGLLGYGR